MRQVGVCRNDLPNCINSKIKVGVTRRVEQAAIWKIVIKSEPELAQIVQFGNAIDKVVQLLQGFIHDKEKFVEPR
jgi:hypothetical protein